MKLTVIFIQGVCSFSQDDRTQNRLSYSPSCESWKMLSMTSNGRPPHKQVGRMHVVILRCDLRTKRLFLCIKKPKKRIFERAAPAPNVHNKPAGNNVLLIDR